MSRHLVVVGDVLLDRDVVGTVRRLAPDAPAPVLDQPVELARPGGAGLAAALARADGLDVTLVSSIADDPAGDLLRDLLHGAGVRVVDLGGIRATPQKIRVGLPGRPLLRIDHGSPGCVTGGERRAEPEGSRRRVELPSSTDGVLVSDYGCGVAESEPVRRWLAALGRRVPVVWDPHPKGARPVEAVRLATPNRDEAMRYVPSVDGEDLTATAGRAERLLAWWSCSAVAVTMGAAGALLVQGSGPPRVYPADPVSGGDPCGAGDRFAVTAAAGLAAGLLCSEAVAAAVTAATRFVAAGGAGALARPLDEPASGKLWGAGVAGGPLRLGPELAAPTATRVPGAPVGLAPARDLIERVRTSGGTAVATSGCFDLVHAGHVRTLQAARGLGDCLVVLLNADRSVRRLKGPGRPLVAESDRAAVLAALACVDAVVMFEEDTPNRVLGELRPHLFAKGGDYALTDLAESAVLGAWGGQAVVLPYVEGRSTTRLLREVVARGVA